MNDTYNEDEDNFQQNPNSSYQNSERMSLEMGSNHMQQISDFNDSNYQMSGQMY
jgi:hypothetical protein